MISVIIPVLNEEEHIGKTLRHLNTMEGDFETIVVDGGSRDSTKEVVKKYAVFILSKKGRALQMNTGAGRASGDVLFFLHADCLPEKDAFIEINETMKNPEVIGGALKYDVDKSTFIYRNHVFWSSLRARLTGIYLGDHGLFVDRSVFDELGGFPHIPLMEDVALCKMLKKRGKLVQCKSRIIASTRRFERQGFFRSSFRMWAFRTLYFMGVSPDTLEKFYADAR